MFGESESTGLSKGGERRWGEQCEAWQGARSPLVGALTNAVPDLGNRGYCRQRPATRCGVPALTCWRLLVRGSLVNTRGWLHAGGTQHR